MHDSVTGVAASGASPIVRIRNADLGLIKRALDTGAQYVQCPGRGTSKLTSSGLMIPMVNTPAEAEFIVKASKFPPMGVRGQGSPFSSWSSSLTTPEYVKMANENLLTIVQIETEEAVNNSEAIAAVPGVGMSAVLPPSLVQVLMVQMRCSSALMISLSVS